MLTRLIKMFRRSTDPIFNAEQIEAAWTSGYNCGWETYRCGNSLRWLMRQPSTGDVRDSAMIYGFMDAMAEHLRNAHRYPLASSLEPRG